MRRSICCESARPNLDRKALQPGGLVKVRARIESFAFTFASGGRGVVILRVLIIVVLGQRSIDEVQDHSGHVDLTAIEKIQRLPGKTRRSVVQPYHKDGGINLWRQARGIVSSKDRRAVDHD